MGCTRHPELVQLDTRLARSRNSGGYQYSSDVARKRYDRAGLPTYWANALLRAGVFHPEVVSDWFLLSLPFIGVRGLRMIRERFPANGVMLDRIGYGLMGPVSSEELGQ